jgi:hypothetical protein
VPLLTRHTKVGAHSMQPDGAMFDIGRFGIGPLASRIREVSDRSAPRIVALVRSGNHAAPDEQCNLARMSEKESIMPHKMRIALAATLLALAAVSTVDTASAFPRFGWWAVPLYGIPL